GRGPLFAVHGQGNGGHCLYFFLQRKTASVIAATATAATTIHSAVEVLAGDAAAEAGSAAADGARGETGTGPGSSAVPAEVAAMEMRPARFLKNSSASFFAVESISRAPSWASLPPTCALAT